jgi:methyl-accepting chemotaxis protein
VTTSTTAQRPTTVPARAARLAGIPVALCLVLGGVGLWSVRSIAADQAELSEVRTLLAAAQAVDLQVAETRIDGRGSLLAESGVDPIGTLTPEAVLTKFAGTSKAMVEALDELDAAVQDVPAFAERVAGTTRPAVEDVRAKTEAYLAAVLDSGAGASVDEDEAAVEAVQAWMAGYDTTRAEIVGLIGEIQVRFDEVQASSTAAATRDQVVLVVVLAAVLIALAVTAVRRARTGAATEAAADELLAAAAAGDLSREITLQSDDPAIDKLGTAVKTLMREMRQALGSVHASAIVLSNASVELAATGRDVGGLISRAEGRTGVVAGTSHQVTAAISTVAVSAEQMTASIDEIAGSASTAATVATEALAAADRTNATVVRLGSESERIGEIVTTIASIAEQTNLLALNATIEAARAGEAGKGFAVVAAEVKELAQQTSKATDEIGRRIGGVQESITTAVEAVSQIQGVIERLNDLSSSIAAAVEEQAASTKDITLNVNEAALGSSRIGSTVDEVVAAAAEANVGARQMEVAAGELTRLASDLEHLVGRYSL